MPADLATNQPLGFGLWKAGSANIAYGMVSIWLTAVKTRVEIAEWQKTGLQKETGFLKIRTNRERLLAILLDTGGAQAGKAVLVDRELPGQEFIDGQRVAAASLLEGEQSTTYRGDDFGLAADYPPFGPGCRQIRDR
jgi:hypothetical protein